MNKNKFLQFIENIFLPVVIILTTIDEMIVESEMTDKIDDIIFFILTLLAFILGFVIKGKWSRYLPLFLFIGGLITKIIALVIEHDDFRAVDHDYGVLALMIMWVYLRMILQKRK